MGLTRYEQEVVINFNAEEDAASIYTANPIWLRKMEKLAKVHPENFKQVAEEKLEGKVVSRTYEFPKDLITIRSAKKKVNLSEEQRITTAERLLKSRGQERKNLF